MNLPTRPVVYIVVGTLSFTVVTYVSTLAICAWMGLHPDPKVLEYLKDVGLLAAGGLGTILAQTKNQPGDMGIPINATVTNSSENPVNVTEQPNP